MPGAGTSAPSDVNVRIRVWRDACTIDIVNATLVASTIIMNVENRRGAICAFLLSVSQPGRWHGVGGEGDGRWNDDNKIASE